MPTKRVTAAMVDERRWALRYAACEYYQRSDAPSRRALYRAAVAYAKARDACKRK